MSPGSVRRLFRLDVAFALLIAVMAAHEAEHIGQLLQKEAFPNRCPGDWTPSHVHTPG